MRKAKWRPACIVSWIITLVLLIGAGITLAAQPGAIPGELLNSVAILMKDGSVNVSPEQALIRLETGQVITAQPVFNASSLRLEFASKEKNNTSFLVVGTDGRAGVPVEIVHPSQEQIIAWETMLSVLKRKAMILEEMIKSPDLDMPAMKQIIREIKSVKTISRMIPEPCIALLAKEGTKVFVVPVSERKLNESFHYPGFENAN